MRLLDTSSLDLISVPDDAIPPYAILSHTWGNNQEEVSFQELQELNSVRQRDSKALIRHPVALKKGFSKIRSSAALALAHGFRFIWIDTCCIDKNSSAELSEAINSMYRWYQGSAVCYAFLSDVRSTSDRTALNPIHGSLPGGAEDVASSRWFTRGWTLQELIAPANVYFYNCDWAYLGRKCDNPQFRDLVSSITGIDGRVLDGLLAIEDVSVAGRMAWASKRNTTRLEDTAYCLMGIFQVNMPLLYGEGSRAFIRLQEEILKCW
jgi:hypothetical protein